MYYYGIVDRDNNSLMEQVTPYGLMDEAVNAALDALATVYVSSWPVEVRIFESPSGNFEDRYIVKWLTVWQDEVKQHALKRIEEVNREELTDIILHAQEMHEAIEDRYMRGNMTPSDYAKAEYGIWVNAVNDIERIEARG